MVDGSVSVAVGDLQLNPITTLQRRVSAEVAALRAETGLRGSGLHRVLGLSREELRRAVVGMPPISRDLLEDILDRIQRYRSGERLDQSQHQGIRRSSPPAGFCALVEAAERLGVTVSDVYTRVRDGRLEAERVGDTLYIPFAVLEQYQSIGGGAGR